MIHTISVLFPGMKLEGYTRRNLPPDEVWCSNWVQTLSGVQVSGGFFVPSIEFDLSCRIHIHIQSPPRGHKEQLRRKHNFSKQCVVFVLLSPCHANRPISFHYLQAQMVRWWLVWTSSQRTRVIAAWLAPLFDLFGVFLWNFHGAHSQSQR